MLKYRVKVNPDVFRILDKHVIFLAKISPKSAHSLNDSFFNTIKTLHYKPNKHPLWLPDFQLPKPYHKIIIKKRYQILFYIDSNTVYVDYFLDCRMNSTTLFQ